MQVRRCRQARPSTEMLPVRLKGVYFICEAVG